MPSCNTYRLIWVSLTLGVSLQGCSSKAQPLLLTLDEGYLLTAALPDLQCGIAPLGPLAPTTAPGNSSRRRPWPRAWVAPPGLCPWPQAWGCGVTPLIAAPDLGRGVAPLGLRVFKKKLQSLEMLIPTLYVTVYIPWWHRYKGWL